MALCRLSLPRVRGDRSTARHRLGEGCGDRCGVQARPLGGFSACRARDPKCRGHRRQCCLTAWSAPPREGPGPNLQWLQPTSPDRHAHRRIDRPFTAASARGSQCRPTPRWARIRRCTQPPLWRPITERCGPLRYREALRGRANGGPSVSRSCDYRWSTMVQCEDSVNPMRASWRADDATAAASRVARARFAWYFCSPVS